MLAINRDERLLSALEEEAHFWKWDAPSPLPDAYVFADTGDEPVSLYPHLEDMKGRIESSGASLHIVKHASGMTLLEHLEDMLDKQLSNHPKRKGVATPPLWTVGSDGRERLVRRQCTSHFKINLINKWVRSHYGVKRTKCDHHIFGWLGISSDEIQRMKSSTDKWRTISHPLVYMRWSRGHCAEYLDSLGIKVQRSACVYCPFRTNAEFLEVKRVPEDWDKLLRLDNLLTKAAGTGWSGMKSPCYLHRTLKRMSEINLEEIKEQLSLWDNECAGVCGV
jgi:hypothetical protein